MVIENFIPLLHSAEVKAGGIVADTAPHGRFVLYQLIETVDGRF
jgi:hypothetical protein